MSAADRNSDFSAPCNISISVDRTVPVGVSPFISAVISFGLKASDSAGGNAGLSAGEMFVVVAK